MSDPYVGEIRMFAGNFAPKGWAFCHGQLIPLQQNTALYSILGNQYGGDGKTTFALPNLIGRAPMHQGQGPGLKPRTVGEIVGRSNVTLIHSETPAHTHVPQAINAPGNTNSPQNAVWAQAPQQGKFIKKDTPRYHAASDNHMALQALRTAGMGQPHNNRQPYLGVNFIIALEGNFPPRS